MTIEQKISTFLAQILENSFFVVEVRLQNPTRKPKLLVLLDGDNGVTISVCAEITKKLNQYLDEQSLINTAYTLEVSSAGADAPLKLPRQYPQHIGRNLQVIRQDGIQMEGLLQAVLAEGITLQDAQTATDVTILWEQIQQAKVLISFK